MITDVCRGLRLKPKPLQSQCDRGVGGGGAALDSFRQKESRGERASTGGNCSEGCWEGERGGRRTWVRDGEERKGKKMLRNEAHVLDSCEAA